MPKISIVLNCDTRAESQTADSIFSGTVSLEYLTTGLKNKKNFFSGIDHETILFIDEHMPVPDHILSEIRQIADVLVVRKHTNEHAFNDYNYLNALSLARGEYICHVDQDTACFTSGKEYIEEYLSNLENHKFVSYPSHWTPNAITDESFGGRMWASTRFFICKRETLKFDVLRKCIENPEWAYDIYGHPPRKMNWTEHFLTLTNENSCYYPPVELHKGAIFSWSSYKKGTLEMLNSLDYETVKQWILHRGGIQYPVDVKCD